MVKLRSAQPLSIEFLGGIYAGHAAWPFVHTYAMTLRAALHTVCLGISYRTRPTPAYSLHAASITLSPVLHLPVVACLIRRLDRQDGPPGCGLLPAHTALLLCARQSCHCGLVHTLVERAVM